jgi:very-short-patch-repair endonuclease
MHYNKKIFAQEPRRGSTPEEQKLWEIPGNRKFMDLKFRRQHVLEGLIPAPPLTSVLKKSGRSQRFRHM